VDQENAFANFARSILFQAKQLRLGQTSASLAFLTMLALVPLFSVGLWALTLSPRFATLKQSFLLLVGEFFLPAVSATVLRYLNEFAAHVNQLPLWAAAGFLLTALLALNTFEKTLNLIWGFNDRRSASRKLILFGLSLLAGPILAGAVIALAQAFGTPLMSAAINWIADTRQERRVATAALKHVWPFMTVVAVLTLAYRFVPNGRVWWQFALLGAVVAALLIEALKWALGTYLVTLPSLKTVYGALAVIPILLIWLNGVWLAILIGAVLAAVLQRVPSVEPAGNALPLPGGAMTADALHQLIQKLKTELSQTTSAGGINEWYKAKQLKSLAQLSRQNRALLIQYLAQHGVIQAGNLPGIVQHRLEPERKLIRWSKGNAVNLRELAWGNAASDFI
jgi:YihY family inner membrane protein